MTFGEWFSRWWNQHVVADDETSRRLDRAELRLEKRLCSGRNLLGCRCGLLYGHIGPHECEECESRWDLSR